MKKVLMMSVLLISAVAFGQTEKGSKYIGGGVGFSTSGGETDNGNTTVDAPTFSTYNVSPSVGYFVADDLAVGLMLNVSGTKWKDDANDSKNTTSTFGVSLFAKKYKSIVENFYVFGQANVGFGAGSSKNENNGTSVDGPKTSSFFVGVAPGVEYFFSPKVSMSCSVGALSFVSSTEKEDFGGNEVKDKDSTFDLNLNLSAVNFGFYYFF
mgnify:CR=1 FL=1|tara:strand:- start:67253 stop:67882 length:630 start_codon:yes stop_codon:yes gene_type:complete